MEAMCGLTSRRKRSDRGAAAVEFAIVLPIFLMLVFGAIDFGYYLYVTEIVTNAAREGARAGSVVALGVGQDAVASKTASDTTKSYLTNAGLTKTATINAQTTGAGTDLSVDVAVSYPVGSLSGFFGTGAKVALPANTTAHAVMRWQ